MKSPVLPGFFLSSRICFDVGSVTVAKSNTVPFQESSAAPWRQQIQAFPLQTMVTNLRYRRYRCRNLCREGMRPILPPK